MSKLNNETINNDRKRCVKKCQNLTNTWLLITEPPGKQTKHHTYSKRIFRNLSLVLIYLFMIPKRREKTFLYQNATIIIKSIRNTNIMHSFIAQLNPTFNITSGNLLS